jgi:hypothetical protein
MNSSFHLRSHITDSTQPSFLLILQLGVTLRTERASTVVATGTGHIDRATFFGKPRVSGSGVLVQVGQL